MRKTNRVCYIKGCGRKAVFKNGLCKRDQVFVQRTGEIPDRSAYHRIPSKEEAAWFSGIFEGEGCFITKGNAIGLQIVMTDRDTIERVGSIFNLGKVTQNGTTSSNKEIWRWIIQGYDRTQFVLCFMWPWLGARRRTRASEIMMIGRGSKYSRAETGMLVRQE